MTDSGTGPFRLVLGALSDVGRVRNINQDSFLVHAHLGVLADGMGGHRGGEVASKLAVETFHTQFARPEHDTLISAIAAANQAILDRAEANPSLHGMGTTICVIAAVVADDAPKLCVANVGDSRVYRYVDSTLTQVSSDHSLVETMVQDGRLTPAEAEVHPQRNIVTRALGAQATVDVDWWLFDPIADDRYLLCSDGLSDEVSDQQIADVLGGYPDPAEAAARLVNLANEQGGRDNITVVVADIVSQTSNPADMTEAVRTQAATRAEAAADGAPDQTPPPAGAAGESSAASAAWISNDDPLVGGAAAEEFTDQTAPMTSDGAPIVTRDDIDRAPPPAPKWRWWKRD